MAKESPLFQSAMELVGHSIEHFNSSSELDRKLVILHLANAVELLLKDLLLDLDVSIYKNPKETITIQGAVQELEKQQISLNHFNKVELLIDERNALQHRYGSPNELTTVFYMDAATDFFTATLSEHYALDFDEVLPQFIKQSEFAAFMLRKPTDESELDNLRKVANVHPVGAFLSAIHFLEMSIQEFLDNIGVDNRTGMRPAGYLISSRLLDRYCVKISEELSNELNEVRKLRNSVAHGRYDATKQDVERVINTAEKLESELGSQNIENVRKEVETQQKAEQERRQRMREDRNAN